MGHLRFITLFRNCIIELLDRCDNQLGIIAKLPYQGAGVIGDIDAIFFEAVKFPHGLIVKVFAIYHKNHLLHIGQIHNNLAGLERCKGFARAGSVPDIAIIAATMYFIDYRLGGVKLVWPEHH